MKKSLCLAAVLAATVSSAAWADPASPVVDHPMTTQSNSLLENTLNVETLTEQAEHGHQHPASSDPVTPPAQPSAPETHEHGTPSAADSDMTEDMGGHAGHVMDVVEMDEDPVTPQQLIFLNMARDGSGTSWQPVDNPMQMLMGQAGPVTTMLHWNAFLDWDDQGGPRGDEGIYSQNWIMGSAAAPVGKSGVLQARAMFSLEPLTVGKKGYPLLFQVGETYNGEPLVDRQHPHDLFMELSAQYYQRVTENTWLRFYGAPVGEPAVGPVAFPHRYSAFMNPESIMGHHSQDSTHIAFGVLTAGVIHKNKLQVEGSIFNGREPDENRYDFDMGRLDSYAGRISYLPNKNWALQASYAYLQEPESLEPGNVNRLTASVNHSKTWSDGFWASLLSFGHNFKTGPDEYSILLESTVQFKKKNYVFGRIENFQRHGLLAHGHGGGHAHESEEREKDIITAISFGIARDLFRIKDIPLTLGAMLTMYAKPGRLDDAYGNFPLSYHVFLHTNAPSMRMAKHSGTRPATK